MTSRRLLSAAMVALGAALVGCSAEPMRPEAATVEPKQIAVEWRVDQVEVEFGIGSDRAAPGQLAMLDRFLAAYADDGGLQIFIDADPAIAGREVADRRVALLERHVAAHGLTARPLVRDAAAAPAVPDPRVATVYAGRFVAVAPACPDWRKPTAADYTNTNSSNFGCATAVNLSRMLANPGDLLHGQTMGPADGERAALSIRRYREGKQENDNGDAASATATTMSGVNP